ncbi:hypothetical protein N473_21985 [Pseudoalteromonas luteoviolacea CPMOR-1]|uniref:Uncharacterized protein n=2 Tax=Pseudoalteromonas luteoviolacea TaxID=43657 RepID=A0A167JYJ5_9GAMM|nr:hypothetical protein N473_21985 [Pseudoalteromonas luteoviolacea CPMOR-1]
MFAMCHEMANVIHEDSHDYLWQVRSKVHPEPWRSLSRRLAIFFILFPLSVDEWSNIAHAYLSNVGLSVESVYLWHFSSDYYLGDPHSIHIA